MSKVPIKRTNAFPVGRDKKHTQNRPQTSTRPCLSQTFGVFFMPHMCSSGWVVWIGGWGSLLCDLGPVIYMVSSISENPQNRDVKTKNVKRKVHENNAPLHVSSRRLIFLNRCHRMGSCPHPRPIPAYSHLVCFCVK